MRTFRILVLAAVVVLSTAVTHADWTVTQLTDNGNKDYDPHVDGNDIVDVLFRLNHNSMLKRRDKLIRMIERTEEIQPLVERNLIVSRPSGMKLCAGIADEFDQP